MVDSVSQASWFTVDADTYRYFFSASAQVFAAIFAVVAVAFSLANSELEKKLNDISREKRRKAAIYKEHWKSDVLKKHYAGRYELKIDDDLKSHVWELDERIINDALVSIQNRVEQLLKSHQDSAITDTKKSDAEYHAINIDIGRTIEDESRNNNKKSKFAQNVKISASIAALMTILSLAILWLEKSLRDTYLPFVAGFVFCLSIGLIGWLFVKGFSALLKNAIKGKSNKKLTKKSA